MSVNKICSHEQINMGRTIRRFQLILCLLVGYAPLVISACQNVTDPNALLITIAKTQRQASLSSDVLRLMLPCPVAKASANAFVQVLNAGFTPDHIKLINQSFVMTEPSWKDLRDITGTSADNGSKELVLRSTSLVALVGRAFLQVDLQGLDHKQLDFLARHIRVLATEPELISLLQHPLDDAQMYLLGNTLQPMSLKTEAGILALTHVGNRASLNGRVLIADDGLLATALKSGWGVGELKNFVGTEQLHPGSMLSVFEKKELPDVVAVDFLLANREKLYADTSDIAAFSDSTLSGSQISRLLINSNHAALQVNPRIVIRLKLKGVEDAAILGLTSVRHDGMPSPPNVTRTLALLATSRDNYSDPVARVDPLNRYGESDKPTDSVNSANGGVYRIGGDVSAPILISKVEPEYSDEARKACYEGIVLLSFVVDSNGMPRDIHVMRPLGRGLDEQGIEAVTKWRFRPGMKEGRAVATLAQAEVNFRLLGPCSSGAATPGKVGVASGPNGTSHKTYKDRSEYDLFSSITKTQDPKVRLTLLDRWLQQYPNTDFHSERLQYFVATLGQLASSDPSLRGRLIDDCGALLAIDPKNFRALYLIALWGPIFGRTNPSLLLRSQVFTAANGVIEGIDAAFDLSRKPSNVSEADFAKAKNQTLTIARKALSWEKDVHSEKRGHDENLAVQVVQVQWNSTQFGANGFGKANLLDGSAKRGFDFTFNCSRPFLASEGSGYYPGRWRKPDLRLEIVTTQIGNPKKHEACELKVALQPFAYEVRNSSLVTIPIASRSQ